MIQEELKVLINCNWLLQNFISIVINMCYYNSERGPCYESRTFVQFKVVWIFLAKPIFIFTQSIIFVACYEFYIVMVIGMSTCNISYCQFITGWSCLEHTLAFVDIL